MEKQKMKQRQKEIIKELNKGNTENFEELLKNSIELSNKYEPCKCGFISKNKETGICKLCLN